MSTVNVRNFESQSTTPSGREPRKVQSYVSPGSPSHSSYDSPLVVCDQRTTNLGHKFLFLLYCFQVHDRTVIYSSSWSEEPKEWNGTGSGVEFGLSMERDSYNRK